MLSPRERLLSVVNNPEDEKHYNSLCAKTLSGETLSDDEMKFATTLGYRVGPPILSRLFQEHAGHKGIARALTAGAREEEKTALKKAERPSLEQLPAYMPWNGMSQETRERLEGKAKVIEAAKQAEKELTWLANALKKAVLGREERARKKAPAPAPGKAA